MSSEELKDRIRSMILANLMLKALPDELTDDVPLFGPDGLGLDSIDALELVVGLEKTFGVRVPDSETARRALATISSMHDYVLEQGGTTRAPAE